MSTSAPSVTGTAGDAYPIGQGLLDPRRRGRLILPAKVIEKIAGQAASEIAAAHGRSGGVLGLGATDDPQARPTVDAELSDRTADLAVAVGIAYPGSIRRAVEQIRRHVGNRVEELTGVEVRRIDVDVTHLAVGGDRAGERRALR